MNLAEWTVNYVEHKDAFLKKLKEHKVNGDVIEFVFSDKKHHYILSEKLEAGLLDKVKKYDWKTIVCLNTKENLKVLIENWKKFAAIEKLYILFVSEKGKWIICPKIHNSISEPESLEQGLNSLFNTAEGKYVDVGKE